MSSLEQIANVVITAESVGIDQTGFGVPLIMSYGAAFPSRVRSYSKLTGVQADFAITTPEYKQAQALFSQPNKPPVIKIGRCTLPPTQRYKILVQTVANATAYKVDVNGLVATFTSDANATNDEIVAGLVTQINLLAITTTASAVGSVGVQQVQLLGDSAGAFNAVDVRVINEHKDLLKITQDHVDPGVATDLTAIDNEDNNWYFILNAFNSTATIDGIGDYAESHDKLFVAQTNETDTIAVAAGADSTSPGAIAKADGKVFTSIHYHPNSGAFFDAGLVGRFAPLTPGSETWCYKTVSSVAVVVMTASEQANALAKNVGIYHTIAGVGACEQGKVAIGEYIDQVRLNSLIKARIREAVFGTMFNASKVPFTNPGIGMVGNAVKGALDTQVLNGGIVDGSVIVNVPKLSAVPTPDKQARTLRQVTFSYQLAGAIHFCDPINGVVTV